MPRTMDLTTSASVHSGGFVLRFFAHLCWYSQCSTGRAKDSRNNN
jgi:hypothetical protein